MNYKYETKKTWVMDKQGQGGADWCTLLSCWTLVFTNDCMLNKEGSVREQFMDSERQISLGCWLVRCVWIIFWTITRAAQFLQSSEVRGLQPVSADGSRFSVFLFFLDTLNWYIIFWFYFFCSLLFCGQLRHVHNVYSRALCVFIINPSLNFWLMVVPWCSG